MAIPISANPALADLLEWYCSKRIAYFTSGDMELRTLREFGGLASVCGSLRMAPRCLHRRRSRATNMFHMDIAQSPQRCRLCCYSCIGAPLHVVKYMGGWAKNTSVREGKYIDPTMSPSSGAWQYFG
jgi:hypothetical protein